MPDDTRCSIKGCGRRTHARGWCGMHYQRWFKHGGPLRTLRATGSEGTFEDRFWARVDANGVCWEWTGPVDRYGYGDLKRSQGTRRAHRISWEILVGPIPEGFVLDHLCRNRSCVNPEHLEPVTSRENTLRGIPAIPRSNHPQALKTHCRQGHEYSDENTMRVKGRKGHTERACRTCKNASTARWREAQRGT